ncbi:MAG TPA: DUF4124 domain-containing protein [Ramlibacter sp.]|nr:DUF4124 domain-containing protein [Ramlibacter sp.]
MAGSLGQRIAVGLLLAYLSSGTSAQSIFTCVDSKGRRLTADRPIAECTDREQSELSATGTVKRKIGPTLTPEERAAEEEKARKVIEERNRLAEEKKRDRALLTRYPNKAAHDKERVMAIAAVDDAVVLAGKNAESLVVQRKRLENELEFYKTDPAKTPAQLKRQIEENQQHIDAQKRFVATQETEKKRINARFDEELGKLKQLWAQRAGPAPATAAAMPTPTTPKP